MKNKFYTNAPPALTPEVFGHPTAEYRGAPFWAWNCRVTPELIDRQLGVFREMGFGGAHVHSREGLAVPYRDEAQLQRAPVLRHRVHPEGDRAGGDRLDTARDGT